MTAQERDHTLAMAELDQARSVLAERDGAFDNQRETIASLQIVINYFFQTGRSYADQQASEQVAEILTIPEGTSGAPSDSDS